MEALRASRLRHVLSTSTGACMAERCADFSQFPGVAMVRCLACGCFRGFHDLAPGCRRPAARFLFPTHHGSNDRHDAPSPPVACPVFSLRRRSGCFSRSCSLLERVVRFLAPRPPLQAQYGKHAYWDERYTKYVPVPLCDWAVPDAPAVAWGEAGQLLFDACCYFFSRSRCDSACALLTRVGVVAVRTRCRDPEPFDWYQRYSGLKDLVGQYLKKSDHIMMSGCGNSRTWRSRFLPCVAPPTPCAADGLPRVP